MHLTGIRLGGIPPFTEPIVLRFDEQVNVFIGPNASGKSTLLLALENHFTGIDESSKRPITGASSHLFLCDNDSFNLYIGSDTPDWATGNYLSADEEWVGKRGERIRNPKAPPVIVIGSVREGLAGISNQPDFRNFGKTAEEILAGPFGGSRTVRASDFLGNQFRKLGNELRDKGEQAPYKKLRILESAEDLAAACSKRICNEVIRDTRPHNYITDPWAQDVLHDTHADLNDINVLRGMGLNTTDARNFEVLPLFDQPARSLYPEDTEPPIYLGHASSGTEGTLLWIWWLALKIAHHYDFEEPTEHFDGFRAKSEGGWDKKPAILLIDEIENHLHPTWQRRVIPALLEHFPGLQIFATTHSPFVVAGLRAGQVHVLQRDENGVVTASTEQRDVIGWTADEILRGMMGVDDPTDDATAVAAKELRELRNEGPRVAEKSEEVRQQRMEELRAVINRDLLAGGPMAAQRELFERNLAEILEEHRRAQGLSQD